MNIIRKANQRGHAKHSWLDSFHTFSFGNYYDPQHMGFGVLRVINDDRIKPGTGFDTHNHRDMEIISYVLEGELEHKDSMGNGSIIRPGDVQRMSAGTGILHSEFNPSKKEGAHFLQIWIEPAQTGIEPSYQQKYFAPELRTNQLCRVISYKGLGGAIGIHQNVEMYASILQENQSLQFAAQENRQYWLHVASGEMLVNELECRDGDSVGVSESMSLTFTAKENTEFLLFDLPESKGNP